MGVKVRESRNSDGTHHTWLWLCPACQCAHQCDDRWKFNGDLQRPSFLPHGTEAGSILIHAVTHSMPGAPDYEVCRPRCHSYVRDGWVRYEPDSSHAMAGTSVELPDWADWGT